MYNVSAGLKFVMKSFCLLRLFEKMLSLYSSEIPIEGVSVIGPRCACGDSSPRSSSGYDDGAGPGGAVGAVSVCGAGSVAGCCGCWLHAAVDVRHSANVRARAARAG